MAVEERMTNKANQGCLAETMLELDQMMRKTNPFVQSCQMMHELEKKEAEQAQAEGRDVKEMLMVFDADKNLDLRRYGLPTANEVAAIVVDQDDNWSNKHEIAIHQRDGTLRRIHGIDKHCDPLTYPLLFPQGDFGWNPKMKNRDGSRNITQLQFYSYRIAQRPDDLNIILQGGKLFQQYLVDAFVKVEESRIDWQRYHQDELRADSYKGLEDFLAKEAEKAHLPPGKIVVLASSFPGSPRNMNQNYQDAMAICRKFGKPDIFLTFTCNPKWVEITRELFHGQTASDRPDIVCKVFMVKLKEMMDDLFKKHIFGVITAYTMVIEFQKRGLPHCHMLLMLQSDDKPRLPEQINNLVCAELPDPELYPRLREIVGRTMIHGPCGELNKRCPCMDAETNICTKNFPKSFCKETYPNVEGFTQYQRRENGDKLKVGPYEIDNQWVVPYNPYLLLKFDAHINLEICSTVKSFKYLYKYIFKGHDCARIRYKTSGNELEWNEIDQYLESRYVSPPEAFWRLSAYDMQKKSHAIIRLPVHLENEQPVYFEAGREAEGLSKSKDSRLIAYFKLNQTDPEAKNYLYHDIPVHYVWKGNAWQPRKKGINSKLYE